MDFVIPLPPLVIDTKGTADRGEVGINASVFLEPGWDYFEWWDTQSYGPLDGPIDPEVCHLLVFCFISFENHVTYNLIILSCQEVAAKDQFGGEPAPPTQRGRKRKAPMAKPDLTDMLPRWCW